MRHNVYGRHLSRTKNERTALFKNLVQSLFLHEQIKTSEAKAKAIKGLVDKIITESKKKSSQNLIRQFVTQKQAIDKLTKDIAPRFKNRTSGFTTMVKLGKRQGDASMQVVLSLVESADKSLPTGKAGLESSKKTVKVKNNEEVVTSS